MSRKSKGINAERELIHKFWNADWTAIRVAGSGSTQFPAPDIVAANATRTLAIECKATKGNKYIPKADIAQLLTYAEKAGAEPWVGVRFDREEWLFLSIEALKDSGKNFAISKSHAKERGLRFDQLLVKEKPPNVNLFNAED